MTGDGRTALSGSTDGTVRVWDLGEGHCTAVLKEHTDAVVDLAVTKDGRTAVSGSSDRTIRVWDLASGRCTAVLEGHTGRIDSVAVTADGRTVVSRSDNRWVCVWDVACSRCTATHEEGSKAARRVWATATNGLASTTAIEREPYGLTFRDTTSRAILARFPGSFTDAACSSDRRRVIAGDGRGGVYLLRLHTRDV